MAGGNSSEREIALQSAAQIQAALDAKKYDVTLIDLNGRSWSHTTADGQRYEVDKNDFSITIGEQKINFEYALILIHGTPGEDGRLQGYLDQIADAKANTEEFEKGRAASNLSIENQFKKESDASATRRERRWSASDSDGNTSVKKKEVPKAKTGVYSGEAPIQRNF